MMSSLWEPYVYSRVSEGGFLAEGGIHCYAPNTAHIPAFEPVNDDLFYVSNNIIACLSGLSGDPD